MQVLPRPRHVLRLELPRDLMPRSGVLGRRMHGGLFM